MTGKKLYGTVLIKVDLLIEALYGADHPLTLAELADMTELTRSTALKILETLEHIGYVIKNQQTKKYSIGFKLMKYGSRELNADDLQSLVKDPLERLHKHFNETVHIGIFKNDRIVTIDKYESAKPVICISSAVGETKDLYSSGMGKAVLAELDNKKLLNYLNNHEFVAKTTNTIRETQRLLTEIDEIRLKGYSIDNEENEEGVYCVGASITHEVPDGGKHIIGAFSLSLPIFRATDDFLEEIYEAILATKAEINAEF